MRSMKLLFAMALVAALVAGPVLAQETAPLGGTATEAPAKGKAHKKHAAKKHHAHKAAAPTTAAPAPAAQ
jgi:hypothetical protein